MRKKDKAGRKRVTWISLDFGAKSAICYVLLYKHPPGPCTCPGTATGGLDGEYWFWVIKEQTKTSHLRLLKLAALAASLILHAFNRHTTGAGRQKPGPKVVLVFATAAPVGAVVVAVGPVQKTCGSV